MTATANVRTGGDRRRAELADFLRSKRTSIKPESVGLPNGGRRRTPGLRREEVASLAGIGTTWYTWLEQARDVRPSMQVLEALSRALRLTPVERTHLFLLGRGEEAPPSKPPAERVSSSVRRLIATLGPNPAYLIGRRWDYLAWNQAACAVFGDFGALPRPERNHLWRLFMDPSRRELLCNWKDTSQQLVAKFRGDSARHLDDPAFEELISALHQSSPEFCKAWKRHEVAGPMHGRKDFNHPVAGHLRFEHAALHPADALDQRLILYSPADTDTAYKLQTLLESEAEPVQADGALVLS